MTGLNRVLGGAFDALMQPLRGLPPVASLALLSLLVAVAVLLVFRATSNQKRIATAKRRIEAGLYEIRLFSDDPRAILRAQRSILRHNLDYVRLSLVPMLWMLVPFTLLVAQLQTYYGYQPLKTGESFLLELALAKPAAANAVRPRTELRVPPGLQVETTDGWFPTLSEQVWRLRAERAGRYELEVQVDGQAVVKEVRVADGLTRLSPVRHRGDFMRQILHPAEPPLHDAQLQSVRINYASRAISVFGWELPWLVVFFVLVTAFAWILKGRFRVAI